MKGGIKVDCFLRFFVLYLPTFNYLLNILGFLVEKLKNFINGRKKEMLSP